jgi:heme oxygenase
MNHDIVARLRDATGEAHERLETRLDLIQRVSSPAGRRALVARFYGLHAGAEQCLAPLLDAVEDLSFPDRRRTPILLQDLVALGHPGGENPAVCVLPAPASQAEALGFFYVLEGSTLGGKVIRRELAARGQVSVGLAFLDPYGPLSGEKWRTFLAVLRRECPSGEGALADQAVLGAVSAFRHAESWLVP